MRNFLAIPLLFFLFLPLKAQALVSWAISNPKGEIIDSCNADIPMVPASILKIPTALYALHHLGEDHVFSLGWYADEAGNLVISGSGDPLLTSLPLKSMVEGLAGQTPRRKFKGLVVDTSGFSAESLHVDGASRNSIRTYDAPLSPFSVNFNSIHFKTVDGKIISGEEETPFLPMAEEIARKSGQKSGRISMPHGDDFSIRYAAALARHFLEEAGFSFDLDDVRIRKEKPEQKDTLLFLAPSPFTLADVIRQLMQYSNNFLANQLLLATVLEERKKTPLSMEDARLELEKFLKNTLGISDFILEEASGISRKNRISAREMLKAVQAFSPYMELLRKEDDGEGWYKTGTLSNVRTRAGFFRGKDGWYAYVLMTADENHKYEGLLKKIREMGK